MRYLVFSQANKEPIDEAALVHKARVFFGLDLVFTRRHLAAGGVGSFTVALATVPGDPRALRLAGLSSLTLSRRLATPADWAAADEAEAAGRAGGMGALARRCGVLWEVEAEGGPRAVLALCAVLAAGELGPVMPEDRSTLFGVRGARERAERS